MNNHLSGMNVSKYLYSLNDMGMYMVCNVQGT